jgi:hypothetical protein
LLGRADTLASCSANGNDLISSYRAILIIELLDMPSLAEASKNHRRVLANNINRGADGKHVIKHNLDVEYHIVYTSISSHILSILSRSNTAQEFVIRFLAHSIIVRMLVHA